MSKHDAEQRRIPVGCVSYLNSIPLIDGLHDSPDLDVRFDVPSRLLTDLEDGSVDIALCPVIDFQYARVPLEIVGVGGIGCDGPTMTVCIYSRVPIEEVTCVHADTDSHTSVALMKVIFNDVYGLQPEVIDFTASERLASELPETLLLIGDKVVTDSPSEVDYPYQIDLGQAWKESTGLPFVFAVWMTRPDCQLGELPAKLDRQRLGNAQIIDDIVARYAADRGWPADMATEYLGHRLKYGIAEPQYEAMQLFWNKVHQLGITKHNRPLAIYSDDTSTTAVPG